MIKKSLHVKSIYRSNIISDIRIAKEAGYDAIEAVGSKVLNYLESGNSIDYLKETLQKYDMKIVSVNDIAHCERTDPENVKRIIEEAHALSSFCQAVGSPTIQLVPLCAHEGKPWEQILELTASSVNQILDIGAQYGVRFQLEPVAWSPINSLNKGMEFIKYTGRPNFGTVIDFWHLYYGQGTTYDDVANLDKKYIYNIHFCDGTRNPAGTVCDEEVLRGVYAGEGDIDLPKWVEAVKKTGYDGYWSYELISRKHWEHDTKEVAEKTKALLDKYLD
ncbi:sugar phosphate isomerase/epimerase family protein [Candidatus Epulonipiscium viviparus]|uniref:sugar phosphate isomerase/epimerase family protein n=1 Tax=Candidatus Epulonipiscium viviparus TaxID=420336 RepID=UPI00068EEC8C|nr:sugar phosphate isomerase/epimerase family protein [Candidatus Epulopiscium viviparus]